MTQKKSNYSVESVGKTQTLDIVLLFQLRQNVLPTGALYYSQVLQTTTS